MFTCSDLTYVAIPVWIIWDLNMSLQRKLGLVFVMNLGLLFVSQTSELCAIQLMESSTMVASIMKTITSQSHAKTTDSECM